MKRLNLILFAGWVTIVVSVISLFRMDYWDGFNFLLQARALTGSGDLAIAFDAWRPRGLVGLFAIFNHLHRSVTGDFPGLRVTHLLMLGLTVGFLFTWKAVFKKLWGDRAANLGFLLLLLCPLVFHYAFALLADIYTGLFWAMALGVFLSPRPSMARALVGGSLGALAGLGKYHYLPLFPTFLALLFFFRWKRKLPLQTGPCAGALVSFILTAEIVLRLTSPAGWGLVSQLAAIRTQAAQSLSWHSPWTLYLDALVRSMGWPFWVLTIGIAVVTKLKLDERAAALALTTVLFLGVNQLYPHREIRYLIPLLPALLGFSAWIWTKWEPRTPGAWSVGLAVVLCWPAVRLGQEASNYLTDPVYDTAHSGLDRLWPEVSSCSAVHACLITLHAERSEYPADPYYRRYDLGPQYAFFAGVPASVEKCPEVQSPKELPASFFSPPASRRLLRRGDFKYGRDAKVPFVAWG